MKESERGRDTENKADLSQSKQKWKAQKSQKTHWDGAGDTELKEEKNRQNKEQLRSQIQREYV